MFDCIFADFFTFRTFISHEKIRTIGYRQSENAISLYSREQNIAEREILRMRIIISDKRESVIVGQRTKIERKRMP